MRREIQDTQIADVLAKVQLPLTNIEYHIDQYLLINGTRLDTQTRILLAHIRDSVSDVACKARDLSQKPGQATRKIGRAA